jgi:transposase
MRSITEPLALSADERRTLEGWARSQKGRADVARRARAILLLADGASYRTVAQTIGWSSATIAKWKARFRSARTAGLWGRHQGSRPRTLTPRLEARILTWTRKAPPSGATHWSTRRLAKQLGITHTLVHRAWQRAGLRPHRLERDVGSTDRALEAKAADIIGLYVRPPQHAAVFCLDDKTAIQALHPFDPMLPLSPGRAECHGFEYHRHGALSLYAALNTPTGGVVDQPAARHTSAEFVAFLTQVVASRPAGRDIHIILDNLSTPKTRLVRAFLAAHPQVQLHVTPTYSTWLDQVELWFARIERDLQALGIFTSVKDLARKIRGCIQRGNRDAKPFRWTYTDPTRRIA